MPDHSEIAYVPPPSMSHELGILFGFVGVMILAQVVFSIWFKMHVRSEEAKEREIVEQIRRKSQEAESSELIQEWKETAERVDHDGTL